MTSRSLVLLCAAAAAASLCSADLLYNQSFDGTGNLFASQNDTNSGGFGNFATTYDNFTLPTLSTVGAVSWVGAYFNPGPPGTITGFTVQFYGDNAGVPGASIYSTFIAGNANEGDIGNYGGFEANTYSALLPVGFTAAAGTQYWLSVEPDMGFPPQWGWSTGTGGDGAAYQVFLGAGGAIGNDMTFALASTPEPMTFGLIGLGLAGIALAKFRRVRS